MAKLTFWKTTGAGESLVGRTKKDVQTQMNEDGRDPKNYSAPAKVELTYTNAFDLFIQGTKAVQAAPCACPEAERCVEAA